MSACAESPVDPARDPYEDTAAAGFSSLVLAVDEGVGTALDPDDIRALIWRSIMLRALPPSSIAFLICGATIFAAVLPADVPPVLVFSATGSFSTIVGIDDADGFDTACFHGVIGREDGAGGALELPSTTVDCVEVGLGTCAPAAAATSRLPLSCPDRLSGGGSGSARFSSFAEAGRLVTSCSSAFMIASAVFTETSARAIAAVEN